MRAYRGDMRWHGPTATVALSLLVVALVLAGAFARALRSVPPLPAAIGLLTGAVCTYWVLVGDLLP